MSKNYLVSRTSTPMSQVLNGSLVLWQKSKKIK